MRLFVPIKKSMAYCIKPITYAAAQKRPQTTKQTSALGQCFISRILPILTGEVK